MIELPLSEHDDVGFLSLVQRIVNGALTVLQVPEVYLVQIDNWFDFKWLGWRSRNETELRVPLFTPNRVLSQDHFVWNVEECRWLPVHKSRNLHLKQPGRMYLAESLNRFSQHAAFIWYTGNSLKDKAGSLMFYLSGADCYSWYASFKNKLDWQIHDEFRITRRELLSFEERGRAVERFKHALAASNTRYGKTLKQLAE